ncbi:unnamed protein product [Staurois parvus]|uniref:Uncharacterized protein n=1 Tax=Staurois parvus TaxID=386267 RepID=A0ABN9CB47_9NEOB|nr:unnamed protein product [Staurois parvus]
MELESIWQPL